MIENYKVTNCPICKAQVTYSEIIIEEPHIVIKFNCQRCDTVFRFDIHACFHTDVEVSYDVHKILDNMHEGFIISETIHDLDICPYCNEPFDFNEKFFSKFIENDRLVYRYYCHCNSCDYNFMLDHKFPFEILYRVIDVNKESDPNKIIFWKLKRNLMFKR